MAKEFNGLRSTVNNELKKEIIKRKKQYQMYLFLYNYEFQFN